VAPRPPEGGTPTAAVRCFASWSLADGARFASLIELQLDEKRVLFCGKKVTTLGKQHMAGQSPRVAIMLDLQWPYKRHSEIFAGVQRYAEEQGWVSIIDEFAHDALPRQRGQAERYDGIVARANLLLARRAVKLGVPVVNVWPSSPARHLLPGVFPDS